MFCFPSWKQQYWPHHLPGVPCFHCHDVEDLPENSITLWMYPDPQYPAAHAVLPLRGEYACLYTIQSLKIKDDKIMNISKTPITMAFLNSTYNYLSSLHDPPVLL